MWTVEQVSLRVVNVKWTDLDSLAFILHLSQFLYNHNNEIKGFLFHVSNVSKLGVSLMRRASAACCLIALINI
jgi:hypothetical protein